MKVGDTFPVSVAGHVVAQAKVAEVADGKVTLVIPGTVAVMGVRTEIAAKPADTSGTETIVTGVDRAEAPVEAPATSEAPAETPAEAPAPAENTSEAPAPAVNSEGAEQVKTDE